MDSEFYDESGTCLLKVKLPAIEAAIIDSKTNGLLYANCTEENRPWVKTNEFDFDSVN